MKFYELCKALFFDSLHFPPWSFQAPVDITVMMDQIQIDLLKSHLIWKDTMSINIPNLVNSNSIKHLSQTGLEIISDRYSSGVFGCYIDTISRDSSLIESCPDRFLILIT